MNPDHNYEDALTVLAGYDRDRISPELGEGREAFLARLLAEAQVYATLAVAQELAELRAQNMR